MALVALIRDQPIGVLGPRLFAAVPHLPWGFHSQSAIPDPVRCRFGQGRS